jgi:hypothetical protein
MYLIERRRASHGSFQTHRLICIYMTVFVKIWQQHTKKKQINKYHERTE